MPAMRIVYLFGAGATIAEATFAGSEQSLALSDVSEAVIKKAMQDEDLKKVIGDVEGGDIKDIEYYISLLESMHIKRYSDAASKLRSLFCSTIQEGLVYKNEPIRPTLTMCLLQLHQIEEVKNNEEIVGIITLNYDSLLDRAVNEIFGQVNYGMKCKCVSGGYNLRNDGSPLVKLHGSFNWRSSVPYVLIDEDQTRSHGQEEMLWIPPSIEKEIEQYPFNMLWGVAFEILDCDTLRIVGCRLSQNDWGLISLLLSTQLRASKPYLIELINSHDNGQEIRERNGFLKNVKILGELDGCQEYADYKPKNVFETWLRTRCSLYTMQGVKIGGRGYKYIDSVLGVGV